VRVEIAIANQQRLANRFPAPSFGQSLARSFQAKFRNHSRNRRVGTVGCRAQKGDGENNRPTTRQFLVAQPRFSRDLHHQVIRYGDGSQKRDPLLWQPKRCHHNRDGKRRREGLTLWGAGTGLGVGELSDSLRESNGI